jgi:hypothetical protein
MDAAHTLLLLWAALSFWVLGQIWYAQLVIYPLFAHVGENEYVAYHGFYSRHIPLPVILPGFGSFLLPIAVALWGPELPGWMNAANIGTGIVGLLVTVLLAIPRHNRLVTWGRNLAIVSELVRYNWPRTASVTVQAIVTLAMLSEAFRAA